MKRQINVLLKVKNEEFIKYKRDLESLFASVFYFAPEDEELRSSCLRLLKRFFDFKFKLDFYSFLDLTRYAGNIEFISKQNVKNVPGAFKPSLIRDHPEFRTAFDLLNKERDETVELLNDKSFVNEFKQMYVDAQYEDEYVDNEDFADDLPNAAVVPDITAKELPLFKAYVSNPTVFEKANRKSADRTALCQATGLAHEQIEGWFIMLNRNPRRDYILRRYADMEMVPRNRG